MKKLWDISPFVDEASPVFPGDTAYSQRLHFGLDENCPVNVHALTLSPHVGAHSKAPMRLIGIDTPSIDPADSSTLPCHHLLLQHDLRVLENLVLDDVPEGDYELIALPLKLRHSDAAPVRAVLRALA